MSQCKCAVNINISIRPISMSSNICLKARRSKLKPLRFSANSTFHESSTDVSPFVGASLPSAVSSSVEIYVSAEGVVSTVSSVFSVTEVSWSLLPRNGSFPQAVRERSIAASRAATKVLCFITPFENRCRAISAGKALRPSVRCSRRYLIFPMIVADRGIYCNIGDHLSLQSAARSVSQAIILY